MFHVRSLCFYGIPQPLPPHREWYGRSSISNLWLLFKNEFLRHTPFFEDTFYCTNEKISSRAFFRLPTLWKIQDISKVIPKNKYQSQPAPESESWKSPVVTNFIITIFKLNLEGTRGRNIAFEYSRWVATDVKLGETNKKEQETKII